jgi:hypothetical protein
MAVISVHGASSGDGFFLLLCPRILTSAMKLSYGWMRDLHHYLGLFLCPVILIFALKHAAAQPPLSPMPTAAAGSASAALVTIEVLGEAGSLSQAGTSCVRSTSPVKLTTFTTTPRPDGSGSR